MEALSVAEACSSRIPQVIELLHPWHKSLFWLRSVGIFSMQEDSILLAQTEGSWSAERTLPSWHDIPRDPLSSPLCLEMVGAFTLPNDFAHFFRQHGLNW